MKAKNASAISFFTGLLAVSSASKCVLTGYFFSGQGGGGFGGQSYGGSDIGLYVDGQLTWSYNANHDDTDVPPICGGNNHPGDKCRHGVTHNGNTYYYSVDFHNLGIRDCLVEWNGEGHWARQDPDNCSVDDAYTFIGIGYLTGPTLDEGLELSENQITTEGTEGTVEESWDASAAIDTAWITDLGLSPVVLDYLLDRFRGMACYFPFVRLSDAWTAASMAEDRPFLLLAAVAAASSNYPHLQDALNRRFKESLSQRVVMAGEKDLDLLQGILVHLAWFHFHFIPGSRQDYLYLQIAISMVIDLRLDQETADVLEQRTKLADNYTREACRAYLGCYYMSRIIAMSSGRPNLLQFHDNILRCAMMLQQEPEAETDLLIYPVTKVLQFSDEVHETYRSEGIHCPRLYIHAERFSKRLYEWWLSISTDLRNTVLLINSYYSVKIRIEEMNLVYRYGQRQPPSPKAQEDSTMLSAPPMVISNLTKCVRSTKEYLDSFFAIPAAEHNNLPFSAWCQVIFTLFVLYRLSVKLPEVPEWNVEISQQTVDLQEYLDTLLSHLHVTQPSPDRQIPTKSLFSRLPEVLGSVKTSYALAKEDLAQVRDSHEAHHQLKPSNTTNSSVQRPHRCPALRYSSRRVTQAPAQPILQNAIATEVQMIEDEKLWFDIMLMDTSNMTGSSSLEF
ncbi:conserved hypothetical protein [Paecilomyces variotii No. 5]|uniref:Xylanolytic transcriptional activator regulatory domain-containing protein n=1 Tax=Byssochlamys spectabilis (strain No. 5 / NBRC 109023) TaxID=1356009 RepID=V5HZW3_BYSSN|nr:conserved hypothetical protein [Paecilomyces variotii No. 5]